MTGDCEEVIPLLYRTMNLKDNETLPEESRALIWSHLGSCEECRTLVEEEPRAEPTSQAV
jgi:predicted anti-sigma-YlaC factor YlaD